MRADDVHGTFPPVACWNVPFGGDTKDRESVLDKVCVSTSGVIAGLLHAVLEIKEAPIALEEGQGSGALFGDDWVDTPHRRRNINAGHRARHRRARALSSAGRPPLTFPCAFLADVNPSPRQARRQVSARDVHIQPGVARVNGGFWSSAPKRSEKVGMLGVEFYR